LEAEGHGRARIASLRSPLWKGGGNVHGPQPRDWSYQMPKKMRRGALRSALSERLREGNLDRHRGVWFQKPKTKDFVGAALAALGRQAKRKTLIVDSLDNANLVLSSRNVEKTKVVEQLRREHLRHALSRKASYLEARSKSSISFLIRRPRERKNRKLEEEAESEEKLAEAEKAEAELRSRAEAAERSQAKS
jgi:ribosomal protein L4